jgi:ferredoxin
MPRITADGTSFDVEAGTRLVTALAANGADVSHRCGGHARCTTCRVSFTDGEPDTMTQAEFDKLGDDRGDFRLSCQIACDHDMTMDVLMKVADMEYDEAGAETQDTITPDPERLPISELEANA